MNRNTGLKAYSELGKEGIIDIVTGVGCLIAKHHSPLKKSVRNQRLTEAIDTALVHAPPSRPRRRSLSHCCVNGTARVPTRSARLHWQLKSADPSKTFTSIPRKLEPRQLQLAFSGFSNSATHLMIDSRQRLLAIRPIDSDGITARGSESRPFPWFEPAAMDSVQNKRLDLTQEQVRLSDRSNWVSVRH